MNDNKLDKFLTENRTEAINIRVTKTMKDFLEHIAEGKGTSVSNVVVACIKIVFNGEE